MKNYYNYLENVTEDAKREIEERMHEWEFSNREELEEAANECLWVCDGVTGNGSESYWFSVWKAEEALCHNWDILADAIAEFGSDTDILKQGAEACDVTIRCYLLPQAIATAIDELEEEGKISYPEEEEEN